MVDRASGLHRYDQAVKASGRQPVGRGPTVDLLAIFCGPRAIRFYKVFVGRMLAAIKSKPIGYNK